MYGTFPIKLCFDIEHPLRNVEEKPNLNSYRPKRVFSTFKLINLKKKHLTCRISPEDKNNIVFF